MEEAAEQIASVYNALVILAKRSELPSDTNQQATGHVRVCAPFMQLDDRVHGVGRWVAVAAGQVPVEIQASGSSVRSQRGTVGLAVTAAEEQDSRHENPPPSSCPCPTVCRRLHEYRRAA
jgi:hypothetical protein